MDYTIPPESTAMQEVKDAFGGAYKKVDEYVGGYLPWGTQTQEQEYRTGLEAGKITDVLYVIQGICLSFLKKIITIFLNVMNVS